MESPSWTFWYCYKFMSIKEHVVFVLNFTGYFEIELYDK
jgi:hypothetical protein